MLFHANVTNLKRLYHQIACDTNKNVELHFYASLENIHRIFSSIVYKLVEQSVSKRLKNSGLNQKMEKSLFYTLEGNSTLTR